MVEVMTLPNRDNDHVDVGYSGLSGSRGMVLALILFVEAFFDGSEWNLLTASM
jgi:hypothetical protein